ncbi:MAG: SPOR domain-containing protein [Bdellovibrionales bacterium]|nr:SPOR domain-containing protein [Bdellovibrionales bacterium]
MSDKPSLYVVEKREVVILVILFVLVTVLSFTVGVKYGESIGRRTGRVEMEAEKEHRQQEADKQGGTLGAGEAVSPQEVPAKAPEEQAGGHAEGHAVEPAASPEAHAPDAPKLSNETVRAVDKNSDEYLLKALRESGVETPVEKEKKLPSDVKKVKPGSYVIQVGSYPTKRDADQMLASLRKKGVEALILPPFKDQQGEWYRVVVGSYSSRGGAEKDAKQMQGKGLVRSFFVKRIN